MHIDNTKVLKTLIYADDDVPPLYDASAKRRVCTRNFSPISFLSHNSYPRHYLTIYLRKLCLYISYYIFQVHLEVLKRKNVLLLISGLDISHDELFILEQSYTESKAHAYEIVWIPVIDRSVQWTEAMEVKLETLKASMPWYSVHHPSIIGNAVSKFLIDDWHYRGKPMLVVLDPQGKVLSPNAIHMMWIWQSQAFPFTSIREEDLWEQETWRLELLVSGIDQKILDWVILPV